MTDEYGEPTTGNSGVCHPDNLPSVIDELFTLRDQVDTLRVWLTVLTVGCVLSVSAAWATLATMSRLTEIVERQEIQIQKQAVAIGGLQAAFGERGPCCPATLCGLRCRLADGHLGEHEYADESP